MLRHINTFLGDTPIRTFIKLMIISLVVGIILSALNVTPWDFWLAIQSFVGRLYDLGFDAVWSILKYFVWGAVIVVPIFLLMRLLRFSR